MNNKKIIAFDVDGTLSESRREIDQETAKLLTKLLETKKVAIITGGALDDIQKQVLNLLSLNDKLCKNLILLPTNGSSLYVYDNKWKEIFSQKLSVNQKDIIINEIKNVIDEGDDICLPNDFDCAGRKIQDRDSQITYSARGDGASLEVKKNWDPSMTKRAILQKELQKRLPDFEVKIGGKTSIDITQKGIDKKYAINKLMEYTGFDKKDILFVGDAIYEGGNDFPVQEMGVDVIKVSGPEETKRMIYELLK